MRITRKIAVPMAGFVLVASMLFVTPQANAQTPTPTTHPNFFSGLVQFIAQRFGLDKTQVQSAVNDYHTQKKANFTPPSEQDIENREKTRLDKLVTDGKITSSQETAILAELKTLRSKYSFDSLKNLTPQERRQKMQQMHDEIVSWAKSQGIDSSYVMPGFGFSMGYRKGFMRGRFGNWQSTTPKPTPA